MHGAQQHLSYGGCIYTLRKKCACTRACAPMQRCRSFFAMKAIANLSWVLRERRAGCLVPPALLPARRNQSPDAVRSVQIHASLWRGRRCGVAQASSDHPRWCRPDPVCLLVALALGHGVYPSQKSIFAISRVSFFEIVLVIWENLIGRSIWTLR